jgi:hypothetical protein
MAEKILATWPKDEAKRYLDGLPIISGGLAPGAKPPAS